MIIPEVVRVGSVFYEVKTSDIPIVMNGIQCLGYCDYMNHEILLDTTMQDEQTMTQTFCHELAHAMLYERGINLERMGLTNEQMEKVVDNFGLALHQVLIDNSDIALTPEEYDAKYPADKKKVPEVTENITPAPDAEDVKPHITPRKDSRKIKLTGRARRL